MTKNEFFDVVAASFEPAAKLITLVPADKLAWSPGATFMNLGQLVYHLSAGLGGGMEMLQTGTWPSMEEMEKEGKLENLPSCGVAEALDRLEKDKVVLRKAIDQLSEEDFTNKLVTVPWGMTAKMERMGISFLEHFINHKMQLFTYLKLLGLPVNSSTLYGL